MRRIFLLLLPVVLAVIVFFSVIFILSVTSAKKGALQVTSVPQSSVYLNGVLIGKTPLCKCDGDTMIPIGDYTIMVAPINGTNAPYEEKISINPSVLTVVDRTFGDVGKSSGSVISLIPSSNLQTAQLSVIAIPYGSSVSMDNNPVGVAPLLLQSITDSDHEVTVSKDGYSSKTIRIHGVIGYTLKAIISLAADSITTSSSSAAEVPFVASSSASQSQQQVTILQTPTGFLRVRSTPSLEGTEIAQVHPGETYPFVDEQDGWLEIKLTNGANGWVSAQYAKKQ